MKSWPVFLLVAGLQLYQVSAQECDLHLSGTVYQEDKDVPLAFASIHIKELNKGVITDSLGHFDIEDICPGTYTLVCDHVECHIQEIEHEVEIKAQKHDFILARKVIELDEVQIVGEKVKDPPTQSIQAISGRALDATRGLQLGEAMASLPGISTLKTGATVVKPVIHGLHSNRILILNNGIRQEAQQWGSEHAPEIDPFIATQLTLIKGANSVRYGAGAIGGVVLVEPASLRDSAGIGGKINLVGFSNGRQGAVSGMIEGNSRRFPAISWRLQGTAKKAGNLHTPSYFLENTGLREQNFSAALQYKTFPKGIEFYFSRFNSKLGILSPAHVGGQSDLELALSRSQPLGSDTVGFTYDILRPYQSISHNLAKVKGYWRISDWGKLVSTYAFQFNHRREFDKHKPRGFDENGEDRAELDFKINTHTFETVLEHSLSGDISGSIGASGIYQNNRLDGRPFIPNFVVLGAEGFLIERWKLGKWELEGGGRYDYRYIHSAREVQGKDIYTVQTFKNVSGTVGAIYKISSNWKFNTNLGTAWRPPHVNELFSDGLHHGAGAVEKGDSTLTPERGTKWIGTVTYQGEKGLSGEISLFYHQFNNFIYKRPAGIEKTIRGAFPALQYDQTPARLQGIDVSLKYVSPFQLTFEGKGAYLDARNLEDDQPLIYMPANWFEQSISYEFKNGENRSNSYLKIGLRKVFEQKNVPTNTNPEEADWLPPPEGYELIKIEAGTQFRIGTQSLEIGATVDNLLNITYRDYLNSFRYYADEIGRNISLRLKYIF